MDIAEIARRTDLPPRRLRYVLDQGLYPVAASNAGGRGVPRVMQVHEAYMVAVAALLLEMGIKRRLVEELLQETAGRFGPKYPREKVPLFQAYYAGETTVEIGDGQCWRLYAKAKPYFAPACDSRWRQFETNRVAPDSFEPLVTVRINLTALKDRIGTES